MPGTQQATAPTVSMPLIHRVQNEIAANGNFDASTARCKQIIAEIEAITNRRTITYFGSPQGIINDTDSIQIEDLLRVPSSLDGLDLVLNSGGGFAISAERIINVCKTYVKKNRIKEFRVIVPRLAKSAATMTALGADKILLCDNAELGPIDPQLEIQDEKGNITRLPGFRVYKAVKDLLEKSSSELEAKNEKYLIFLRQYNYDLYMSAEIEFELSKDIAKKIVERKKEKYPDLKYEDFSMFTDPNLTFSHGRLIGVEDLKTTVVCTSNFIEDMGTYFSKTGLDHLAATQVKSLNALIWELFIRREAHLNDLGNPVVKIIEDNDAVFYSFDPNWKPTSLTVPQTQPLQTPQFQP